MAAATSASAYVVRCSNSATLNKCMCVCVYVSNACRSRCERSNCNYASLGEMSRRSAEKSGKSHYTKTIAYRLWQRAPL